MNKEKTTGAPLHGTVASGFEAVRREFARNFSERGEVGRPLASITGVNHSLICGVAIVMGGHVHRGKRIRWC